jgi:hypothetical protein
MLIGSEARRASTETHAFPPCKRRAALARASGSHAGVIADDERWVEASNHETAC